MHGRRKTQGHCAECLAPHALRGDGTVHPHRDGADRCRGSRQPPAPVVAGHRSAVVDYIAQFAPGGALSDVGGTP